MTGTVPPHDPIMMAYLPERDASSRVYVKNEERRTSVRFPLRPQMTLFTRTPNHPLTQQLRLRLRLTDKQETAKGMNCSEGIPDLCATWKEYPDGFLCSQSSRMKEF